MNEQTSLKIVVLGADSELGDETLRQLLARGHRVTGVARDQKGGLKVREAGAESIFISSVSVLELNTVLDKAQPDVVLNLWPQRANSLLHDGNNWRNQPQFLADSTQALLEALKGRPNIFLVYASYAFLYGNNLAATEEDAITAPANDPTFGTAIRAEKLVAASRIPATLLRMGYLYGPQSRDLKAYLQSFRISRPYYSGPSGRLQSYLHYEDAAMALALAAERQTKGIFNVADPNPASFGDFIDYFAVMSGFNKPLHIPTWAGPFAIIIAPQQIELLNQSVAVKSDKISRALGWQPRYLNYRQGVNQILQKWQLSATK